MRQVFLTGATGTIGSALVPRLLQTAGTEVTLLVRASSDAALRARMVTLRAFWGFTPDDPRTNRVMALRGDITQPGLGLAPQTMATVAAATTHIVHCAASVKLNMPLDEARSTAVVPTRSVLQLARQCPHLVKVDLVSTVGVWGRTPGPMPERRLPEVTDFHNTYEAAKAEAERVVWAEGNGLPITLHRPSMVVGNASDGKVMHFQVFYHLCEFLSGVRTFGIMPTLGSTRLDTVPVDWVGNAIAWASEHAETAGQIFHLCAGPDRAIPITELQRVVRAAWLQQGRSLPRLWTLDQRWLERLVPVIGALAGERTRRALRGLPPVLAYLAEDQSFTNTSTLARLQAAGLPLPAVSDYLQQVLGHYLATQGSAPHR